MSVTSATMTTTMTTMTTTMEGSAGNSGGCYSYLITHSKIFFYNVTLVTTLLYLLSTIKTRNSVTGMV
jgi:hypothetical protein